MSEWQPIETAPKDEIILLYRPSAYKWAQVAEGKWNDDRFAKTKRPYWECWFKLCGKTESRKWNPTHWMPLPPPPEK